MSTHPSTAGLDDLSSSDWARESSSLVSILPGVTGDGQLWLVDTCSLSSGSDSEEGGWESRADRSINSSCHNLEKGQRDNVSSSASERETRDFKLKWHLFIFLEDVITSENKESESSLDEDVLWCRRLERQIRKKRVFHISCVRFKATDKISHSLLIYFRPAAPA